MINIDFFAGTGAIERCIDATRTRAIQAGQSAPTRLIASNITSTSITLNWARPIDNDTIVGYKLFANDTYIATTVHTEHVLTGLNDGKTYHLQVLANFSSGDGAATEVTAQTIDITKPTPPTDLRFFFAGDYNSATLAWTASTDNTGVIGYQLIRNDMLFGEIVKDPYYPLDNVELHTYKVRAMDRAGYFTDSDARTMPEDRWSPSKPSNLRTYAITGNSVSLEWNPSSDNVGVIGYEIYRDYALIGTVNTTHYIASGLTDATLYVFNVRALDAAKNFADSDPLRVTTPDVTAPSKPSNLRIETIGFNTLSWDPSTDNSGVVSYRVYRDHILIGETILWFFRVDITEPYTFMVRALDAAGNYTDSDLLLPKDDQPPSKPTNLRASSITRDSVTLEWDASSDNVAVTGYQLYRDNIPGEIVSTTRYIATGLTEATTYIFKVRALDAAGNFADSDPMSVFLPDVTAPSKPSNLKLGTFVNQSALFWDRSTDNVGVINYEVYHNGRLLGETPWDFFSPVDVTEPYSFRVRALDAAGNYAEADLLDNQPPSKPTNLRASAITGNSVTLEWDPSSDNVEVTGYRIYRDNILGGIVSTTCYMATDLTDATAYSFKVRALDASGNFADSEPFPVTTADVTAPSKPTNLRVSTITDNSATLEWDASSDNVAVTGYRIYLFEVRAPDTTPPSTPNHFTASAITSSSAVLEWTRAEDNVAVTGYQIYRDGTLVDTVGDTRYIAAGLSSSTTNRFEACAVDAAGNRSEPAVVVVTTAASNGPTKLEFNRLSSMSGALQWEPPIESGGVTGYQLTLDGSVIRETPDTHSMFFYLTPGLHFFEVRAIHNGIYSDPASISG